MSTYECPQSPVQLAAGCRYRWWHIDSCGRCVPVDESAFYAALRPRVPVCVTVHGSFVTPEALGQQAAQTAAWLQQAAPDQQPVFVFLMWPSGGITTLAPGHPLTAVLPGVDVSVLGQRAEFNGFYLARLLASFEADRPVSLIGHSHGCRVISSALHLLAGGTVQGYCSPYAGAGSSHMRAVFAAAAIDHDWLNPGRRYGAALHRVEALLNLRNRRDWILNLYPLRYPFAPPSLANAGFTSRDLQQLGVWGWKLAELDVSHLVAGRHTWPRYYSQPSIAAAIAPWVFFETSATVSE